MSENRWLKQLRNKKKVWKQPATTATDASILRGTVLLLYEMQRPANLCCTKILILNLHTVHPRVGLRDRYCVLDSFHGFRCNFWVQIRHCHYSLWRFCTPKSTEQETATLPHARHYGTLFPSLACVHGLRRSLKGGRSTVQSRIITKFLSCLQDYHFVLIRLIIIYKFGSFINN